MPISVPRVFNREHDRLRQVRTLAEFENFRFLHDWSEREIGERLSLIKRDFPVAAILSDRTGDAFITSLKREKKVKLLLSVVSDHRLSRPDRTCIVGDSEVLPLATQSIDLIVSSLDLHRINDLPGTLIQIRRALKPDGLFIACMAGGETLYELRQSLMQAELDLRGGASPRVFPFADKRQLGDLMQRAGFALPVVDSDLLHIEYRDLFHLMRDLHGMGTGNIVAGREKCFSPRRLFTSAEEIYRRDFPAPGEKLTATCEIISLLGWAPHASQPQPLRPGSATTPLAEALAGKIRASE